MGQPLTLVDRLPTNRYLGDRQEEAAILKTWATGRGTPQSSRTGRQAGGKPQFSRPGRQAEGGRNPQDLGDRQGEAAILKTWATGRRDAAILKTWATDRGRPQSSRPGRQAGGGRNPQDLGDRQGDAAILKTWVTGRGRPLSSERARRPPWRRGHRPASWRWLRQLAARCSAAAARRFLLLLPAPRCQLSTAPPLLVQLELFSCKNP
jgi:hypothetical protein